MNAGITDQTRPKSLDEVIGNEQNLQIIKIAVSGAKKRRAPIPSFIIDGPAGTGKSTLGNCIAEYAGGNLHKLWGSDIKVPQDIYDLALRPRDGDVVFIDEAHAIGGARNARGCQAMFYEWIEDFVLTGGGPFGVGTPPKVSFVFATTDSGRLSKPLQTRCQSLSTSYYPLEQIEELLVRAANKLGLDLRSKPEALRMLAKSSRATPRIAVMQRLNMYLNYLAVEELPYGVESVTAYLRSMGIDQYGLEPQDLLYLNKIYECSTGGKPVGLNTLIQVTGLEDNILLRRIEPFHLQLPTIRIGSGGRSLTPLGYQIIGKVPLQIEEVITTTASMVKKPIDREWIRKYCENKETASKGIKPILDHFGLTYVYGDHRKIIQNLMGELGYASRQRVGIVKITNS